MAIFTGKWRVRGVVLLLGIALLGWGAWRWWSGPQVLVHTLRAQQVLDTLVLTGRVDAPHAAPLAAVHTGRVVAVLVHEGDQVAADAPLLRLENTELLAQQASAAQRVAETQVVQAEAERQFRRQQQLAAQGFVSPAALDSVRRSYQQAERQYRQAQAQLQLAQAQRGQSELRAPAAGSILRQWVEPGAVVAPGNALLTFAPQQALQIRVEVDERQLGALRAGLRGVAAADSFPQRRFAVRVQRLLPQLDRERGVLEAVLEVPQPPAFLRPEMTVSVELELAQRANALLVPASALDDRAQHLWRVRDGLLEKVAVRVVSVRDGWAELQGGVRAGSQVVSHASPELKAGQRVRAVEEGG